MFGNKNYRIPRILLAAAFALSGGVGCTRDPLQEGSGPEGSPKSGGVSVKFAVSLPHTDQTPGTPAERAIYNLDLFFVPLDGNGDENTGSDADGNPLTRTVRLRGQDATYQGDAILFSDTTRLAAGRYHVYLAANLTDNQRDHIEKQGPHIPYVSTGANGSNLTTYSEIITDFAHYAGNPGNDIDEQDPLESLAMSGRGIDSQDGDFVFDVQEESTSGEAQISIRSELIRVLAKIHLTSLVEENGGISYIPLTGSLLGPSQEPNGWIRLEDLQYMANATNKKLFFYPQTGSSQEVVDPNYLVSHSIRYQGSEYQERTEGCILENFAYYSIDFLRTCQHRGLRQAEVYDESRLPTPEGRANEYTRGFYCLENTLEYDPAAIGAEFSESEEYIIPRVFTTHVMMVAKFTPAYVVATRAEAEAYNANHPDQSLDLGFSDPSDPMNDVFEASGLKKFHCTNEEQARSLLTASLERNNVYAGAGNDFPANGRYSEGTFFTNNTSTHYYTREAVNELVRLYTDTPNAHGSLMREEDFSTFNKGWSYYYTYIDGKGQHTDHEQAIRFTESNIYRNHYYILRLNSISRLGSVNTPAFIRVYTVTDGWVDGGQGESIIF